MLSENPAGHCDGQCGDSNSGANIDKVMGSGRRCAQDQERVHSDACPSQVRDFPECPGEENSVRRMKAWKRNQPFKIVEGIARIAPDLSASSVGTWV